MSIEIAKPKIRRLEVHHTFDDKEGLYVSVFDVILNIRRRKKWFSVDIAAVKEGKATPLIQAPVRISSRKELLTVLDSIDKTKPFAEELTNTLWEDYLSKWGLFVRQRRFHNAALRMSSFNNLIPNLGEGRGLNPIFGIKETMDFTRAFLDTFIHFKSLESSINLNKDYINEISNKKEYSGNDLFKLYSQVFGEEIGDAVEVVFANALTLRIVNREKGLAGLRPNWVMVISNPSALKSGIVLGSLSRSESVYRLGDVTPASILPTDPKVPSLVERIHNKVAIFTTLSMLAEKDPQTAGEIIAKFEEVYDGEVRRSFAVNEGERNAYVDTVILAAITTATYEKKLRKKMIAYGSRWLIYRYDLGSEEAIEIADMLRKPAFVYAVEMLKGLTSAFLTYGLKNVRTEWFYDGVIIDSEKKKDLQILGDLLAKLRIVYTRISHQNKDEEEGKEEESLEVLQTDVPIRSYHQLQNFVAGDVLARSLPYLDSLPCVDERAMRLATKIALGASSIDYEKLITTMVKAELNGEILEQRDLAKKVGRSQTTVHRTLRVLEDVGVVTGTVNPEVAEPYASVLEKYLIKRKEK